MKVPTYLVLVSEDELSQAVLQKLIDQTGRNFVVDQSIVTRGFGNIKKNIKKYITACKAVPHVVLTDLDANECPPSLLRHWEAEDLPDEMLLRVAVREVESWLMADREGLASFLSIPVNRFPALPEEANDPKQTLINAARKSKTRLAREIIPEPGANTSIGPFYNVHLIRFVRDHWDIDRALKSSNSLYKTVERLRGFCAAT